MNQNRKKKGNYPNLRFPEFEGEWEEKRLGEVCAFVRGPFGSALKKEFFVDAGYAVYEQSHAIYGNFNSFRYYITANKFEELIRFAVKPTDLIMSCSGTMGKFSIIPLNAKEGVINQALLKLTAKKGYYYEFVKNVLELPNIQNKLLAQSAGGAIKNIVGMAELKEIALSIPQLHEQHKIASFLTLIDQRNETQRKIIEGYESLIKGISHKLFQEKSKNIKLNDCVTCHSSSLTEKTALGESGIYPIYGAAGVFAHNSYFLIENDSILIIKDGSNVGKLQYASGKHSAIGTLNYLLPQKNICLKYIYYYLQTFNFDLYKVGSGIPHIYFKDYGNEYIYCPNIDEQERIANVLSTIDSRIFIERTILDYCILQKRYLLQNIFI